MKYILLLIGLWYTIEKFDPKTLFEQVVVVKVVEKEKNFPTYLVKKGVRFPEIVTAQMLHETDCGKSAICKECNNYFGMKANSREFNIGTCRGHAKYATPMKSLEDYIAWQAIYLPYYEKEVLHRSALTKKDYYKFLTWIGYAEDLDYIKKIDVYVRAIEELHLV